MPGQSIAICFITQQTAVSQQIAGLFQQSISSLASPTFTLHMATNMEEATAQVKLHDGRLLLVDCNWIEAESDTAVLTPLRYLPCLFLTTASKEKLIQTQITAADDYLLYAELTARLLHTTCANLLLRSQTNRQDEFLTMLLSLTNLITGDVDFQVMLERVAQRLRELIGGDNCFITIWDEETQLVYPMAADGEHAAAYRRLPPQAPQGSITEYALQEKKVITVSAQEPGHIDYRMMQRFPGDSLLGIPLITGGQKVGAAILSFKSGQPFSQEQKTRAAQISTPLALAMFKEKLFYQEREQKVFVNALQSAAAALNASLNLEDVLDEVLRQIALVIPYHSALILLVEQEEAYVVRQNGYELFVPDSWQQLANKRFVIAQTPILQAMVTSRQPIIIADVSEVDDWLGFAWQTGSWLATPIIWQGEVAAFICLDYVEARFYTPHHVNRLSAFATHVSVAFHNARLHQQTEQRVRELSVLQRLAIIGTQAANVDDLFSMATRLIGETLYPQHFGFLLLDKATQTLIVHHSYHVQEPAPLPPVPLEMGIIGWVARSGRPFRTGNVQESAYYAPADHDTTSQLCVPLRTGGQIVGVINAESNAKNFFTAADEWLLTTFADQLGVALEKMELLESERRRRRQSEIMRQAIAVTTNSFDLASILEKMLDYLQQLVSYDRARAVLVDDLNQLVIQLGRGYADWPTMAAAYAAAYEVGGDTLCRYMMAQQQSVWVADTMAPTAVSPPHAIPSWPVDGLVEPMGSGIATPLLAGDRFIGCYIVEKVERFFYTGEQVKLVESLAAQTAVAMQNVHLYAQTRRQTEDLQVVGSILRDLNASPDISEIMPRLDQQIRQMTQCQTVSLLLLDADYRLGQMIMLQQTAVPTRISQVVALNELAVTIDVLNGRVHIVPDLVVETDYVMEKALYDMGVRSTINMPLRVGDQIVGSLNLGWVAEKGYNLKQLPLYQQLADAIALALQRSQLFEEMKRWTHELTMLHELSRQITENISRHEIYQTAVTFLYKQLQYASVSIFSVSSDKQTMILEAIAGKHLEKTPVGHYVQSVGNGIVGRVAQTDNYVLTNDASHEPYFRPSLRIQVNSELALPLRYDGQVVGVLNVDSEQKNAFDESDLAILTIAADQIANAIQNAGQVEQLENRAMQLEMNNQRLLALNDVGRLLTGTLEPIEIYRIIYHKIIHPILQAPHFAIALYDSRLQIIRYVFAVTDFAEIEVADLPPFPLDADLISNTIQSCETVMAVLDDQTADLLPNGRLAELTATYLLITPMVTSDNVLGVIIAQSHAPQTFTDIEKTFISTLASQTSIALENARLFKQTMERATRLETLTALSGSMRAAETLQEMIAATLENAINAVNGSLGSLYLIKEQDDRQVVVCEGVYPHDPRLIGRTFALGEGITGHIALTGHVHITEDMAHASQARFYPEEQNLVQKSAIRSGIGLPLYAQERITGVLYISLPHRHKFTAEEIDFLVAISEIAGSALERLTLLHTLEDRVEVRTQELKLAYEQLQVLDHLKTKFVSDVSHELRTPITNMSLYLDLLDKSKPEKRSRYMEVLRKQTQRLIRLIEDILSLSRLDMGPKLNFQKLDINLLVWELLPTLEDFMEKLALTTELTLAADLPLIDADRAQCTQVFLNLMMNAIQYNRPNGRIQITTTWRPDTDQVCLTIADTGIGIPAEDQPHIFDRFYRGQHAGSSNIPGTGLGMSIVQEITKLHHGSITFDSQIGEGATFSVWLPRQQPVIVPDA